MTNHKNKMRIAIVGCGLIGKKRFNALGNEGRLVACADLDEKKAHELSSLGSNTIPYKRWEDMIYENKLDILIISTPHNKLAEITIAALKLDIHVLVEKPAARTYEEVNALYQHSLSSKSKVRVGFNHRYHRAFRKAKEILNNGDLGELMFVRARYGHGGRVGYEKEWRADPSISGGGELIDQGVHLIDLASMFLGDFTLVDGYACTQYWQMQVDDNAFMMLRNDKNKVAFLHATCTEWKNTFSFEVYGKNGKIEVSGLGGSYGVEKIIYYKMSKEMGPPETFSWEYPMEDDSWAFEMQEFYMDIRMNRIPEAGLLQAKNSLAVVNEIYRKSGYDNCS